MNEKSLLTITEFCHATGIGRTKFYALVRRGELIAVKVGRSTMVRTADLQTWLENLKGMNEGGCDE